MKKFLASLIILVAAAGLTLEFWVKPRVEDMVKASLSNLTSADGAPLEVTTESLAFNPLTRSINASGISIRSGAGATLVSHDIAAARASLTLRGILATATGGKFLPESGPVVIFGSVRGIGIRSAVPGGKFFTPDFTATNVTLSAPLTREILAGKNPPDVLALLYQTGVDQARAAKMEMEMPNARGTLRLDIGESMFQGWRGAHMDAADASDIVLHDNGQVAVRLAGIRERNVNLPPEDKVRRMLMLAAVESRDQQAMGEMLNEMLAGSSPLIGELGCSGLEFALPQGKARVDDLALICNSTIPPDYTVALKGLTAPAALLTEALGSPLPRYDSLRLNAEASVKTGAETGQRLHDATITVPDLGELRCHFRTEGSDSGGASLQALVTQRFADVRCSYTDMGLLARCGLVFSPQGNAEQAYMRLVSLMGGAGQQLAATFSKFIRRPGTLTIASAKPADPFTVNDLIAAFYGGNLASIFTVTATEGKETLASQTSRLKAGR